MALLTAIAVLIAIFRLILVVGGICVCYNRIKHSNSTCCSQEARRKICYASGIIYLLGLLPHTFSLLTTVVADLLGLLTCGQDNQWMPWPNPPVCWTQRIACAVCSVMHVVGALWLLIVDRLSVIWPKSSSPKSYATVYRIAVAFVVVVSATEGLILLSSEGRSKQWLNFPGGSNADCGTDWSALWTTTLRNGTRHMVRVQLLLCEEMLPPQKLNDYLRMSAMSAAPFLIFTIFCWIAGSYSNANSSADDETAIDEDDNGSKSCCAYQDLDSAVNLLSVVIAFWLFCGRPMVVALTAASEIGFVDFGTHLLLTLSIIIPVTYKQNSENSPNCVLV